MSRVDLPRTEEMLERIEQALCEAHGDIGIAARALAMQPRHIHMWMQADPEVNHRLRTAQMFGWAGLETAAYERAVNGVDVPVFYEGQIVGHKKDYSDSLLSQMLKARVPGYNTDSAGGGGNGGVTVNVAVMPRANSYEEWVTQRETALTPHSATIEARAAPELTFSAPFVPPEPENNDLAAGPRPFATPAFDPPTGYEQMKRVLGLETPPPPTKLLDVL